MMPRRSLCKHEQVTFRDGFEVNHPDWVVFNFIVPDGICGRLGLNLFRVEVGQLTLAESTAAEHLRAGVDPAETEIFVEDVFAVTVEFASGTIALDTCLNASYHISSVPGRGRFDLLGEAQRTI